MKRLIQSIPPYLLLLAPIFVALTILLVYSDHSTIVEETNLQATFIKIPSFNIIQVLSSIF